MQEDLYGELHVNSWKCRWWFSLRTKNKKWRLTRSASILAKQRVNLEAWPLKNSAKLVKTPKLNQMFFALKIYLNNFFGKMFLRRFRTKRDMKNIPICGNKKKKKIHKKYGCCQLNCSPKSTSNSSDKEPEPGRRELAERILISGCGWLNIH